MPTFDPRWIETPYRLQKNLLQLITSGCDPYAKFCANPSTVVGISANGWNKPLSGFSTIANAWPWMTLNSYFTLNSGYCVCVKYPYWIFTANETVLSFQVSDVCAKFHQYRIKICDRESEDTHRQTHTYTSDENIIYAHCVHLAEIIVICPIAIP